MSGNKRNISDKSEGFADYVSILHVGSCRVSDSSTAEPCLDVQPRIKTLNYSRICTDMHNLSLEAIEAVSNENEMQGRWITALGSTSRK